jgi:hypothetical protein
VHNFSRKITWHTLQQGVNLNSFKSEGLHEKQALATRKLVTQSAFAIDKMLTYASETLTLSKSDRKQLNIFERKVYRRILGPVYENEKVNWRILTNKEIYARVKKPTIIETRRLNRLCWFGHVVQRMEENRIPKTVLYMNLGTRLRGRPRNRWQDEVREDGRIAGGEGWQEKVHNREEWKKLLRTARNQHILHMRKE